MFPTREIDLNINHLHEDDKPLDSGKKFEGGNENIAKHIDIYSESDQLSTDHDDEKRSVYDKLMNVKGLYSHPCYLFLVIVFTLVYLLVTVVNVSAATSDKDNSDVKQLAQMNIIQLLEKIVLILVGIDMLLKLCELAIWVKKRNVRMQMFKKVISVKTQTEAAEETEYLHNYYRGEDQRLDLSKNLIITDIILTVVLYILLGLEKNNKFNDAAMPLIVLTRFYVKVPFAYCLMLHHIKIYQINN